MRIDRKSLISMINEEVNFLLEACGCGGVRKPAQDTDTDAGMLSRGEALNLVSIIATRTSCPVTRQALSDVIHDLSPCGGGESLDLTSDDAFGAGRAMGTDEREMFSYTGDLPSDPERSMQLGYKTGIMEL